MTRRLRKLPVVAEQYGVSIKTLRRRISSGELPAYRLGKRVILVDLDDVESLLKRIPTVRLPEN